MDMSRKVDGGGWIVTACARENGAEFCCLVGTCIAGPDGTQQEAVLEGLKGGMLGWI
jgi:hypothetical protein